MSAATTTIAGSSSSFVGRDAELEKLDGLLGRALGGAGQVCFVGGEPGVGKTALVQEFTRRAQLKHTDLVVAAGDCSATSATTDAYLPFREILALLTGDTDDSVAEGAITAENASRLRTLVERAGDVVIEYGADLIDVFVPGAALVTRVGGKLVRRFNLIGKGQPTATAATTTDPARVLQQFTNVVRKLADERPLILVIDDVHWADAASIDLLFHLARRIEGSRILVLATYRANEVSGRSGDDRHPLEPVLNEVARYFGDSRIDLDTEDTRASRVFLDRLIDSEPNALSQSFRAELFQHTLGHPLFTLELLQALRERGTLMRDPAGAWLLARTPEWNLLPKRTEGVIAERLGRISQELRDLLAIGAVEGEQFSAQVIAQVAGMDTTAVIRQLSTIAERQHQLVRALGVQKIGAQRIASYRFRHELFRAYLYETLDPVQRSELHFAVGRSLESLHAGALEDIAPALAQHYEQSGELDSCVSCLNLAADAALRRHAPRQAAELLEHALVLCCDITGDATADKGAMLEKRGDALRVAGAFEEARTALHEALAEARVPLTRARLLRKIGSSFTDQHHLREALDYLERARLELPAADGDRAVDLERVQLLLDRGWGLYWANTPGSMAALLEEGNPTVEQFGTPQDHARWLQMRVLAGLRAERYRPSAELLHLAEVQLDAARAADHGTTFIHCVFLHGFTNLWAGNLDVAEASLREALDAAEKQVFGLIIVLASTYLAVLLRLRGNVEAVVRASQAAESSAREANMVTYVFAARANQAWVDYRHGALENVESTTREVLAAWTHAPVTYPFMWLAAWPLAAVLLVRGENAAAREVLELTLAPGQQILPAGMAEAIAQGELQRALEIAREAKEL